MSRTRQLTFLKENTFKKENRKEHGGDIAHGRRKEFRPVDPKRSMHLVLRASHARGEQSMLRMRFEKRIRLLVYRHARLNDVRIRQYANGGNHLHLLIQPRTVAGFRRFLRTVAGLVPRLVTGARKGNAQGPFWDALAYTRVVDWGRAYVNAKFYVIMNELESAGVWHRSLNSG